MKCQIMIVYKNFRGVTKCKDSSNKYTTVIAFVDEYESTWFGFKDTYLRTLEVFKMLEYEAEWFDTQDTTKVLPYSDNIQQLYKNWWIAQDENEYLNLIQQEIKHHKENFINYKE